MVFFCKKLEIFIVLFLQNCGVFLDYLAIEIKYFLTCLSTQLLSFVVLLKSELSVSIYSNEALFEAVEHKSEISFVVLAS